MALLLFVLLMLILILILILPLHRLSRKPQRGRRATTADRGIAEGSGQAARERGEIKGKSKSKIKIEAGTSLGIEQD
jgi:hypothetical protein